MNPPLSSHGCIRAAELYEQYSDKLMGVLRRSNPGIDRDDCSDAVIAAIMSVSSKGVQEDVTKGKLFSLLRKIAQARLIDNIRKQKRRRRREEKKSEGVVTNQHSTANDVDDADDRANTEKLAARYTSELATNDEERKYLQLWLESNSHESIIDRFCTVQQTREQATSLVKQLSDRMRQRMTRLRSRLAKEEKP